MKHDQNTRHPKAFLRYDVNTVTSDRPILLEGNSAQTPSAD